MASILVVAEQRDGILRGATLSAVSFARALAEQRNAEIVGLVIGAEVSAAANELARFLPRVLKAESADLQSYLAESYAPVVSSAAEKSASDVIVATATSTGKDLLPRVAAHRSLGMVSDVSAILGPKTFRRPILAGNAVAAVEVQADSFVVSVRQSEWDTAQPSDGPGEVTSVAVDESDTLGAQVVRVDAVTSARPDLAEAQVVVSGGRGMKASENFKHIEKLADVLGGAMGATRAACDAGLVPNDLQVGQTGKVVAPDLYIAIGISGAIQHLAGMKGSKVIVAINKDSEAPIFQVADYGLVAKWEDSLAELTERVAAIRSQ